MWRRKNNDYNKDYTNENYVNEDINKMEKYDMIC